MGRQSRQQAGRQSGRQKGGDIQGLPMALV